MYNFHLPYKETEVHSYGVSSRAPLSWKGPTGLGFNTVPFAFSVLVSRLNALAKESPQNHGERDIVLCGAGNLLLGVLLEASFGTR